MLAQLEKPVRVHALPTLADAVAKLPVDITPLYRRIVTAIGLQKIIPHEVRQEVAGLIVESPGYFRDTDTSGARGALRRLKSILRKASDGQSRQRCETAWYIHVHSPLLDLLFDPDIPDTDEITKARARYEPVMSAGIAGNSIPFLRGAHGGVTSEPACSVSLDSEALGSEEGSRAPSNASMSKVRSHSAKIDFVVALDVPDNTPLQRTISYLIDDGRAQPYINQTAYLPLKESPIAVSFEMKTEARGSGDTFVQLGIWVAAWHKRMYDLRSCLIRAAPKPSLVSVPLVQVIGHTWHVYFACDRGTSIDVYGPVGLGSTESILSIYALLGSLEAMRDWVETTFYSSLQSWFMCEGADDT